jgi:hypothetical protein
MMGFLSGFSRWLLNSDNFNPFSGIPTKISPLSKHQADDSAAIQRYAPRVIFTHTVQSGAMTSQQSPVTSQRIGHARVQIQQQREGSESPIFDDWFGTAQVDNQELPFTTNCNSLEVNNEYDIVYERTELPTGEAGIRIHEVIP